MQLIFMSTATSSTLSLCCAAALNVKAVGWWRGTWDIHHSSLEGSRLKPWKTSRCFHGGRPFQQSCSHFQSQMPQSQRPDGAEVSENQSWTSPENLYQDSSAAFTLFRRFKNRRWRAEPSLSSQALKPGKDNHPCCFRTILLNQKLK